MSLALDLELRGQIAVLVPAGVHELHEAHAALGEPAGHQAVVGEAALPLHVGAVHVENVLAAPCERSVSSGTLVCMLVRHLVLRDARGDFRDRRIPAA